MEMSDQEFGLIRDLIYERTGLKFEDRKKSFVESRVFRRAAASKCHNPREYYRLLSHQTSGGLEFQTLIEEMTTNETYFFRDYPQLEGFANDGLEFVAKEKRAKGDFSLNIWSACCSTGDEPYTLAIILNACLDDFPKWRIQILGTDIDTAVLETAKGAEYGVRNVKDVVPDYLGKYFTAARGRYRVIDPIRRMVRFEHLNLMDKSRMRLQRGFDFIFCRNALIYFDDTSRKKVLGYFYDALKPGGFLFLGYSESIGRMSAAFEPMILGETSMHRKPTGIPAVMGASK